MENLRFQLSLQRVNVWRLQSNCFSVIVTLYGGDKMVTTEQLCKNDPVVLLEAAIRATLMAISDIADKIPRLRLLQLERHSLAETAQLLIFVLIEVGEGKAARKFSVVVKATESTAVEEAVRTTLNVLNRMVAPHQQGSGVRNQDSVFLVPGS